MEKSDLPGHPELHRPSYWRFLVATKAIRWVSGIAVVLLFLAWLWPHQPPIDVQRVQRLLPDLSAVPSALPQGGDWRGEAAFPALQFDRPIRISGATFSNDLYVFEMDGQIVRVEGTGENAKRSIFLDLRGQVLSDNRGPADLAFHPNFGKAGLVGADEVYVFYKRMDGYDVLAKFKSLDGRTADLGSEKVLIEQHSSRTHTGGAIVFGIDGYLYISSGEEPSTDQTIEQDLLGGVLRIDVNMIGGQVSHPPPKQPANGSTNNYFIPSDNPFVGRANALEEFWALGLRNPYTMSVDTENGNIWLGEVGRKTWEEINLLQKGANYGWSYLEGDMPTGLTRQPKSGKFVGWEAAPFFSYEQAEGNNSIIGGFVYRGKKWPQLTGQYIFGDNGSSRIWAIPTSKSPPSVSTLTRLPLHRFEGITGFGTNTNGEIFISVLGNKRFNRPGQILKLVPNTSSQDRSTRFESKLSETRLFTDMKLMIPASGVIPYVVNSPFWSDGAVKSRWIVLPGDGTASDPEIDRIVVDGDYPHEFSFPTGTLFIKHFEVSPDKRHPQKLRRLETRLIRLTADGIEGLVYQWNEAQTDAYLIQGRKVIDFTGSIGGSHRQLDDWTIPSSADCHMCHNKNAGYILGVNVPQLNRMVGDPSGDTEYNQINEWNNQGMLSGSAIRPEPISKQELSGWPRMVSLDDTTAPLEERAISYLAANCGYCHRKDIPGRPPRPVFDLRFHIPLQHRGLIGKSTVVVPGSLRKSRLYSRLTSTDIDRMPPIGHRTVDDEAAAVISKWIKSLD